MRPVSEPAKLFQIAAVEDVDRLVGVVADVEAGLRVVGREIHRHGRPRHHGCGVGGRADKALDHEAAFARLTVRIAAFLTKRRIVAVEHLDAVIAAVADINPAVIGNLHTVHGITEERRLLLTPSRALRPCTGRSGGCIVYGIVCKRFADPLRRWG